MTYDEAVGLAIYTNRRIRGASPTLESSRRRRATTRARAARARSTRGVTVQAKKKKRRVKTIRSSIKAAGPHAFFVGDKWLHLGGDLEAKPDGRGYVDIRVKGKPKTRLFLDETTLSRAQEIAAVRRTVPFVGFNRRLSRRDQGDSVMNAGALALKKLAPSQQRRVVLAWCSTFLPKDRQQGLSKAEMRIGKRHLTEVLTKYRSGDAGDLYSRQLEDDLVEVMGQAEAAYAEQLTDIGKMLVQAGVLTEEAIGRQGVRFAVRDRFEPLTGAKSITKIKMARRKKTARRP